MQEDIKTACTPTTATNGDVTQIFTPCTPLGKKLWELRKKPMCVSRCCRSRSTFVARRKRNFISIERHIGLLSP